MKKVSTAAAKQSGDFSQQKLAIGLDVGDRSSCYCVLDETGRIVSEQKVSTTAKALQAAFGAMPRSQIALETGMHSPWISRLLSGLGHEVIVAHARNVRLIGESRRDSGDSARENLVQRKKQRTHLTPTGLLMEGDLTQNPLRESCRTVATPSDSTV